MKMGEYVSSTLWNAADDEIEIIYGKFHSKEEAMNFGCCSVKAAILKEQPEPHILLVLESGEAVRIDDHNVKIKALSDEKKASIGRPLDMSIEENKNIALNALKTLDPQYIILVEDMVPTDLKIADYVQTFGDGFSLGSLAYGISEPE